MHPIHTAVLTGIALGRADAAEDRADQAEREAAQSDQQLRTANKRLKASDESNQKARKAMVLQARKLAFTMAELQATRAVFDRVLGEVHQGPDSHKLIASGDPKFSSIGKAIGANFQQLLPKLHRQTQYDAAIERGLTPERATERVGELLGEQWEIDFLVEQCGLSEPAAMRHAANKSRLKAASKGEDHPLQSEHQSVGDAKVHLDHLRDVEREAFAGKHGIAPEGIVSVRMMDVRAGYRDGKRPAAAPAPSAPRPRP